MAVNSPECNKMHLEEVIGEDGSERGIQKEEKLGRKGGWEGDNRYDRTQECNIAIYTYYMLTNFVFLSPRS